ncbi:hypothetical protein B4135_0499 [Caldibacillus debilis]|uniref:Uncharacterized protein n=1 Tax=Caldibacillus debilis TaxID=301148 RepID=A0A150L932_9BACI|nr:hypothetical protein B4135_0499 [Caldibacillus debilis]
MKEKGIRNFSRRVKGGLRSPPTESGSENWKNGDRRGERRKTDEET